MVFIAAYQGCRQLYPAKIILSIDASEVAVRVSLERIGIGFNICTREAGQDAYADPLIALF